VAAQNDYEMAFVLWRTIISSPCTCIENKDALSEVGRLPRKWTFRQGETLLQLGVVVRQSRQKKKRSTDRKNKQNKLGHVAELVLQKKNTWKLTAEVRLAT